MVKMIARQRVNLDVLSYYATASDKETEDLEVSYKSGSSSKQISTCTSLSASLSLSLSVSVWDKVYRVSEDLPVTKRGWGQDCLLVLLSGF